MYKKSVFIIWVKSRAFESMVLQKNKKYNLVCILQVIEMTFISKKDIKRYLPFFVHLRDLSLSLSCQMKSKKCLNKYADM